MTMKTAQLLVLLVTILVNPGAGFPADKRASWDDVNVVAHGLLQLGQGLKEHVDKSKVQMRDVNDKLKAFNASMAELERRQQEQEEVLRRRSSGPEEALGEEVKVKMEEISSRMDRLEGVSANNTGASLIQRLMAAQNRRLDQLVDKIRQQQHKLEKQSLHLLMLQSMVGRKRVKSHRRRDGDSALRGAGPSGEPLADTGLASDCHDLFVRGRRASGVYTVQPAHSEPFSVFCDMTSDEGWTVVQRRRDGSQNFNQPWETYLRGFGSLSGDFWLGLRNIHSLSQQGRYLLQVELSDWTGNQMTARYGFHLEGEEKEFGLHLEEEEASSSAGLHQDIMSTGDAWLPFSTADRDNDLAADVNCADVLSGGWWFSSCGETNLNGRYPRRPRSRRRGMFWTSTQGRVPLKTTVLKIAPATIRAAAEPPPQ